VKKLNFRKSDEGRKDRRWKGNNAKREEKEVKEN
jgi:hypothetical protein